MENIEKLLMQILEEQKKTNGRLGRLEVRMDKLEVRMDKLEVRMDKFGIQQNENTQILKSLEHASQEHKAILDNIDHKIANIEGDIKSIKRDLRTVEVVSANNMASIAEIKIVK